MGAETRIMRGSLGTFGVGEGEEDDHVMHGRIFQTFSGGEGGRGADYHVMHGHSLKT